MRAAATAYGAPSFPWSYFIDQYSLLPPSQIAPSPLMLHNLGAFRLFLMKCHNSNLYEEQRSKHLDSNRGKCDTGGSFLTNARKQIQVQFSMNRSDLAQVDVFFILLWKRIWYLGFNLHVWSQYCILSSLSSNKSRARLFE